MNSTPTAVVWKMSQPPFSGGFIDAAPARCPKGYPRPKTRPTRTIRIESGSWSIQASPTPSLRQPLAGTSMPLLRER